MLPQLYRGHGEGKAAISVARDGIQLDVNHIRRH